MTNTSSKFVSSFSSDVWESPPSSDSLKCNLHLPTRTRTKIEITFSSLSPTKIILLYVHMSFAYMYMCAACIPDAQTGEGIGPSGTSVKESYEPL